MSQTLGLRKVHLERLTTNPFNPGYMDSETFIKMLEDVGDDGPEWSRKAPLLVTPEDCYYGDPGKPHNCFIIVDGEQRFTLASEANWDYIWVNVQEISKDDAKAISFKTKWHSGTLDPLKVVDLLYSETKEAGGDLTHEQIAEKYDLGTRSQASKLIGLHKLPRDVLRTISVDRAVVQKAYEYIATNLERSHNLQAEPLTTSHLKALMGLPEDVAMLLCYKAIQFDYSVRSLNEEAAEIKRGLEKAAEREKIFADVKMKNCPKCGVEAQYRIRDGSVELYCSKYCRVANRLVTWKPEEEEATWWSEPVKVDQVETGEGMGEEQTVTRSMVEVDEQAAARKAEAVAKTVKKMWYKTDTEADDISNGLSAVCLALIIEGNFDAIESISVKGTLKGARAQLHWDSDRTNKFFNLSIENKDVPKPDYEDVLGYNFHYSEEGKRFEPVLGWGDWPRGQLRFNYAAGNWKTGTAKTRVDISSVHEDHIDTLMPRVSAFLERFAGEPGKPIHDLYPNIRKEIPVVHVGGPVELAREFIEFFEKAEAEKEAEEVVEK